MNSMYTAYRGIQASQVGLDVVNQNISNANTEGYSRQRVSFEAYDAYATPQLTMSMNGGQIGMGVKMIGIDRIRNNFFDAQFQHHNAIGSYHTEVADTMKQMEGVLSALGGNGVNSKVQQFFNSLQTLSVNPDSATARSAMLQQAQQMVGVFQTQAQQLMDLQESMVGAAGNATSVANSQLATVVDTVNTQLQQLADLNEQIITITASGGTPNDLLDKRDSILNDLSEYADMDVTYAPNGVATVSMAGQTLVRGKTLVDTLQVSLNAGAAPDPNYVPALITTVTGGHDILNSAAPNALTGGKMKAMVDAAGGNTNESNLYGMVVRLDTLLKSIATQVNTVQMSGFDQNGVAAAQRIFLPAAPAATLEIFNYSVNPAVLADPTLIAAAGGGAFLGSGDGSNALAMAQLQGTAMAALGNDTFIGYFNTQASNLGIDKNTHDDRASNTDGILNSLVENRQRESGVNMEEEMVDLLRFQRSFEASSRVIRTIDQMMQTILQMVG